MPPNNVEFKLESFHLFDSATHEEVMTITEGADLEINVDGNSNKCVPENPWKLSDNNEVSLSLTDVKFDAESLHRIVGVDMSSKPDYSNIQFSCLVQARRHRKKRINKKWLKRFGYKPLIVDFKPIMINANESEIIMRGELNEK